MCCKAECVVTPNQTKPNRSNPTRFSISIEYKTNHYTAYERLYISCLSNLSVVAANTQNQNADAFQVGWNCFRVLWYSMLKIHTYTFSVKMVFSLYGVKSDSINFVKSFICWLFFCLLLYSFFLFNHLVVSSAYCAYFIIIYSIIRYTDERKKSHNLKSTTIMVKIYQSIRYVNIRKFKCCTKHQISRHFGINWYSQIPINFRFFIIHIKISMWWISMMLDTY